jgi:acyl-CoA synthetase (AMP-forming)/AMP-acid ligase II
LNRSELLEHYINGLIMRLFDLLENGARQFPNNFAVVHGDVKMKYRELYTQSRRLASYLESLNLPAGSRVAILFENSMDYVASFFAVFGAGMVAVPIDTSLTPEKIRFILTDCQAEVLMIQSKYERHLPAIIGDSAPVKYIVIEKAPRYKTDLVTMIAFGEIMKKYQDEIDSAIFDNPRPADYLPEFDLERESAKAPTDLAAIFYTSGSTGSSKGVMLSHRNLISNTVATVQYLKLTPRDRIMVILPFYYIYGNSLLLTHILVGGTLVIDNRFLYPELVLDTMEKEEVTGFSGVPSNFMILMNNSTFISRKLESLRYFTQAGGAMAPEVVRKLMNAFSHKEIYIMYGQTEAAPRVSYLPPERLKEKVGSIGIPVPGVTIKIFDDDGKEMAPGEDGEIAVYGDNVMLGYWNQPEEQKQVLRDGWLLTGDLGKMDSDGFFYVVGRKKEIIKAGGNRVSAKEVEECLLENPKIAEATVFGVKDDILVEAIKTVIVLKDGVNCDAREIRNFCRAKLADYKIPKYIEFAESLPKYQSGKVNKLLLMKTPQ